MCSSRVCPTQYPLANSSWDGYWLPETATSHPHLPTPENLEPEGATPLYDFNLCSDLFQPEEIFQLDQPLRTTDLCPPPDPSSKSPPTLLDLGSGMIHRGELKSEPESYWMFPSSSMSLDDSNSSCRLPQCSPESLSQTTMDDTTSGCTVGRPDYSQRMNPGLSNFHFDDKDYSKYQVEDHTRMYSYDDARFPPCGETLIPNVSGDEYPPCPPETFHEPVQLPECYPRPLSPRVNFLPETSQEDPSLSYSHATPPQSHLDSYLFQAYQYHNNSSYFQHLPHH